MKADFSLQQIVFYILQGKIEKSFQEQLDSLSLDQINEILEFGCKQNIAHILYYKFSSIYKKPHRLKNLLRQHYYSASISDLLLNKQIFELSSLLNSMDIEHLYLKGTHLKLDVYKNPLLRDMCDIDILIKDNERRKTLKAVEQLGYKCSINNISYAENILDRQYPPFKKANSFILDIQWKLTFEKKQQNINSIWERSKEILLDGIKVKVMSNEDLLLHSVVHKVDIDNFTFGIRLLYDISEILNNCSIDWKLVIELAVEKKEWNCVKSLYLALKTTELLLNNKKIPRWVLEKIEPEGYSKEIENSVRILILSSCNYSKKVSFFYRVIRGELKNKLLKRMFLPKKEMVLNYDFKYSPIKLAFFYIKRLSETIFIYTKVLWLIAIKSKTRENKDIVNSISILKNFLHKTDN